MMVINYEALIDIALDSERNEDVLKFLKENVLVHKLSLESEQKRLLNQIYNINSANRDLDASLIKERSISLLKMEAKIVGFCVFFSILFIIMVSFFSIQRDIILMVSAGMLFLASMGAHFYLKELKILRLCDKIHAIKLDYLKTKLLYEKLKNVDC